MNAPSGHTEHVSIFIREEREDGAERASRRKEVVLEAREEALNIRTAIHAIISTYPELNLTPSDLSVMRYSSHFVDLQLNGALAERYGLICFLYDPKSRLIVPKIVKV